MFFRGLRAAAVRFEVAKKQLALLSTFHPYERSATRTPTTMAQRIASQYTPRRKFDTAGPYLKGNQTLSWRSKVQAR